MLKVGLLGTGNISEMFVQATKNVEGIEATAVFNRDQLKANIFADQHRIKKAYNDINVMLNDEEINCIYIGLPNSMHFDYAIKALKAGKTTIIEKPFVSTLVEFDQIKEASEESRAMVFEMTRVMELPNYKTIKDSLELILPVRLVTVNFSQYSRRYNDLLAGKMPNVFSDEFSGGALMDLGVYGVHLMVGLFGKPRGLLYVANHLSNSVDLSGNLIMKYKGFIASLVQSKNSKCDNRITIQGERGTMYITPTASILSKVELDMDERTDISAKQEHESMVYTLEKIVGVVSRNEVTTQQQMLAHSRDVMEVMEKARRSAGISFVADNKKKL
ncbi:MAG: Gfo/Idh/MocA family oxidoreductase [Erysipelotrichaceae bacterium]|nr:Gfo/Idh/MocA family oxidoreductase [Erysipelotrichaceae bacterium]